MQTEGPSRFNENEAMLVNSVTQDEDDEIVTARAPTDHQYGADAYNCNCTDGVGNDDGMATTVRKKGGFDPYVNQHNRTYTNHHQNTGKWNDRKAEDFHILYMRLIKHQEAEETSVDQYIGFVFDEIMRECADLMMSCSSLNSAKRELPVSSLRQCLAASKASNNHPLRRYLNTDRQLNYVLQSLTTDHRVACNESQGCDVSFDSDDSKDSDSATSVVTCDEIIHCYKICVAGMQALAKNQADRTDRSKIRNRAMKMMAFFQPSDSQTANDTITGQCVQVRTSPLDQSRSARITRFMRSWRGLMLSIFVAFALGSACARSFIGHPLGAGESLCEASHLCSSGHSNRKHGSGYGMETPSKTTFNAASQANQRKQQDGGGSAPSSTVRSSSLLHGSTSKSSDASRRRNAIQSLLVKEVRTSTSSTSNARQHVTKKADSSVSAVPSTTKDQAPISIIASATAAGGILLPILGMSITPTSSIPLVAVGTTVIVASLVAQGIKIMAGRLFGKFRHVQG